LFFIELIESTNALVNVRYGTPQKQRVPGQLAY